MFVFVQTDSVHWEQLKSEQSSWELVRLQGFCVVEMFKKRKSFLDEKFRFKLVLGKLKLNLIFFLAWAINVLFAGETSGFLHFDFKSSCFFVTAQVVHFSIGCSHRPLK